MVGHDAHHHTSRLCSRLQTSWYSTEPITAQNLLMSYGIVRYWPSSGPPTQMCVFMLAPWRGWRLRRQWFPPPDPAVLRHPFQSPLGWGWVFAACSVALCQAAAQQAASVRHSLSRNDCP